MLETLKHVKKSFFDYEIHFGGIAVPLVGKSWETPPYSKPKPTKSYTNKCLVFKGPCPHKDEVSSSVSQMWTRQGESTSIMLGLGAGAPLLLSG